MDRLRGIRPSRRVLAAGIIAFVLGGGVLALFLIETADSVSDSRELSSRIIPIQELLDETRAHLAASEKAFHSALEATDSATRGTEIARAERAANLAARSWTAYERLALGLPGERALRARYDELGRRGREAGVTAFSIDPLADPAGYDAARSTATALAVAHIGVVRTIDIELYSPKQRLLIDNVADSAGSVRRLLVVVAVACGVIALGVLVFAFHGARVAERVARRQEREQATELRRSQLESELQRGLEMEPNEEATYEVIRDALRIVLPGRGAEMLVADSSRAHFRRVLSTDPSDAAATCQVGSPSECPAANAGQTRLFPDSEKLDACPYLRRRLDEPLDAVCVPISIAGQTVAVLHTAAARSEPVGTETLRELELVARKAGDRITVLRVLARTEAQAHVDMLTGLFNRRTLEDQVHDIVQQDRSYVVLFADLDHFKDLNDVHGHEIGDRALRLFARVVRDSVRPNDIPARYGGEEFVIVLPDCTVGDACLVAERVQARLAEAVGSAAVPPFTVTIGVAAAMPQEAFGETVGRADTALLYAKGAGRNRVVVDTDIPSPGNAAPGVRLAPSGAPEPLDSTAS